MFDYFTKYRMKVINMRNNELHNLNKKEKVFDRLYNHIGKRKKIINDLTQKYLLEESNNYPYFPKINKNCIKNAKFNPVNNTLYSDIDKKNRLLSSITLRNANDIKSKSKTNQKIMNQSFITNKSYRLNSFEKDKEDNHKKYIKKQYKTNKNSKKIILNNIPNSKFKYKLYKYQEFLTLKNNRNSNNFLEHSLDKLYFYNKTPSNNNNYSSIINSNNNNSISKTILEELFPQKEEIVPEKKTTILLKCQKYNKRNYTLKNQITTSNYSIIHNNPSEKIGFLNTKQNSISSYNITISQKDNLELNPKSMNNNYVLFPSKTNSISLSFNDNQKEEKNGKIYYKKITAKKLNKDELKKLKIYKGIKKGKKIGKFSLVIKNKNKDLNDIYNKINNRNKNLKIDTKILINSIDNINKAKEPITVIQTITDEKMMEIAGHYLKNDDSVDKKIVEDILSRKRK